MLLTFLIIIVTLVAINFALLFFSCNKTKPAQIKPTPKPFKAISEEEKITNQSKVRYLAATGS